MCLAVRFKRKSGRRTGYKVLFQHDKEDGLFTGTCGAGQVRLGPDYIIDPNTEPIRGWDQKGIYHYPAGFSISGRLEDAKLIQRHQGGVICKVAFKDEVAYGRVHWTWWTGMEVNAPQEVFTTTIIARQCKVLRAYD